jgi:type II secretory pathway pseudopilin PulG
MRMAFTLVEVLIGAAIMALMLLALFGGISYGFSETQLARENLRATQIMLEKMEGIRLYSYDQILYSNLFSTTFTNQYYPLVTTNQSPGPTYYGQILFSNANLGTAYSSNMLTVTVSVTWTNSYGAISVPRTRQMQSMIGRWGIQNYSFYN